MLTRCFSGKTLVSLIGIVFIGTVAHSQDKPLVINIDSPNFRKLVIAVPEFRVGPNASGEMEDLAEQGAAALKRLLEFTGMFNVMSEAAYKDLMTKLPPLEDTSKDALLTAPEKGELKGIDIAQWKALGVESLTIGEISKDTSGMILALRTVDINRGTLILGKRYRNLYAPDFMRAVRRYADHMLVAYTGKNVGMFFSKLVFVGRTGKGKTKQIYVSDFDGNNLQQITDTNATKLSPSWSPDGRFVTYTSYEEGNPDLFIYEVATKRKRKLSSYRGLNSGSTWAKNGKLIVYSGSVEGDTDLYVIAPRGGSRSLLIHGSGLDAEPALSPDGQWLAFVSGRYGNPHIFRAKLAWSGEESVKVVEDKRLTYAGWYNASPAWSPDSGKIAFAGYDKDVDRFDLFMVSFDGTNMERMTIYRGDNESPSWSPNGQMIVFQTNRAGETNQKEISRLYMMNRDGSNQRALTGDITKLYEVTTPRWGPNLPPE